ncbi:unnamed protein product [Oncorhynchus mykiss]|uniref:Tc1-like transposase DDE domain-containing protein n=1 Tax=Oncorhynchus mykiss TaxID=8022 RepID=A0A060YES5_ONCMY|nr:unnamed protein product [Oncorhynchus mykiss]
MGSTQITWFPGSFHCIIRLRIDAMDWPDRSPDLNPIEHIWDIMSRSIHQRHVAPQTVQELADALVRVWEEIPQETIRHLLNKNISFIQI